MLLYIYYIIYVFIWVHTRMHIICIRNLTVLKYQRTNWFSRPLIWNYVHEVISIVKFWNCEHTPFKMHVNWKKVSSNENFLKGEGAGSTPSLLWNLWKLLVWLIFFYHILLPRRGGGQTSSKHFPSTSFFWPDPFSHMVRFYKSIIGGWLPMCPQLLANHKDSVCSTFPPS